MTDVVGNERRSVMPASEGLAETASITCCIAAVTDRHPNT